MAKPDRELRMRALARGRRRYGGASMLVLLLVLALSFGTTARSALAAAAPRPHASSSGIPGYDPAAIDRALKVVAYTQKALQQELHRGRKHGKRHK